MAYADTTLAEMRVLLAARYEGVPWWTTADALQAINEALHVWQLATGYWRSTDSSPLVPNDYAVPFGSPIVMATRLEFDTRALVPTSLFDLDAARPGWQGARGDPWAWVAVSLRLGFVYPATAEAAQVVSVEGLMRTPVLVSDGDFVTIGAEELNAILDYALHALSYWQGGAMLQQTEANRMAFWKAAALRNRQLYQSLPLRESQGRHDELIDPPSTEGRNA